MNRLHATLRRSSVVARSISSLMLLAMAMTLSFTTQAVEPLTFDSPEQEERFDSLTEELRCLVCQNQSLADSDAVLAQDLRNEVYVMLQQGNSNEEIKRFLVDRYGDFVLYRPPFRRDTLLLWLSPLLLLTTGGVVMAFTISRRRVMLAEEALEEAGHEDPSPDDKEREPETEADDENDEEPRS